MARVERAGAQYAGADRSLLALIGDLCRFAIKFNRKQMIEVDILDVEARRLRRGDDAGQGVRIEPTEFGVRKL